MLMVFIQASVLSRFERVKHIGWSHTLLYQYEIVGRYFKNNRHRHPYIESIKLVQGWTESMVWCFSWVIFALYRINSQEVPVIHLLTLNSTAKSVLIQAEFKCIFAVAASSLTSLYAYNVAAGILLKCVLLGRDFIEFINCRTFSRGNPKRDEVLLGSLIFFDGMTGM